MKKTEGVPPAPYVIPNQKETRFCSRCNEETLHTKSHPKAIWSCSNIDSHKDSPEQRYADEFLLLKRQLHDSNETLNAKMEECIELRFKVREMEAQIELLRASQMEQPQKEDQT